MSMSNSFRLYKAIRLTLLKFLILTWPQPPSQPSCSSWLQQRLLGSDWLEADVVVSPSATSPHTPHYTRACYYGERKSWSTELLIGVCLNTPGSSPMESLWYSAVLCLVPHVVHLGTDVRRAVPVVPHAARHLLTEDPREKSRVELDIWTTQPSSRRS